jgi:anti-sigma factor RsiW
MNCHSFKNVLDLYAEGRLTPRRAMTAAEHLAACAACRALAAPAASPSGARAPQALKDRLRAAAKAAPSAPEPRAASGLPLWPREARGIALAALALIVVALLVAAAGLPSQSSGGAVAAVEEP